MWWNGRMMALDLETTSPDPEDARIVSVAVAYVGAGRDTATLGMIVNPGVEIPAEATEVHGITTERARAEGVSVEAALAGILMEVDTALGDGIPVVIFNARYDLTVLDRELRRHEERVRRDAAPLASLRVIDPHVIDKHLHRFRPGSRRLDATCEHYSATLAGAHEAEHDAIAAARLAWCLGHHGEVVRRVRSAEEGRELARLKREWAEVRGDLDALHEAQRGWAAEQAEGLERYFREGNPAKGVPPQPDAVVERAWPIVPVRLPVASRSAGFSLRA